MNAQTFTIGTEPFSEWVRAHKEVEELTLQGTLANEDFEIFEKKLFTLNLKVLRLRDFHVTDHKYNEEYIHSMLVYHNMKFTRFQKIVINSDRIQDFIFCNGWIFSEDKKTLIHVPENVIDYVHPEGVEYIGKATFYEYTDMKTVTFNNSLVEIGEDAFNSCGVFEFILPDSVTTIGEYAFSFSDIEKIQLSENLQEIPDGCFRDTYLKEIKIPNSVKRIGSEVFHSTFIEEAVIPEGVESIGYNAFYDLIHISLPSTLEKIASDFYYRFGDDDDDPPYVEIHPDNPIFYAENGTLYFRETKKLALDWSYDGIEKRS